MNNAGTTKPLSAFIETAIGGGTPPRNVPSYWSGSIPWASVKDLNDSLTIFSQTEEHISESGLNNSAANLVPAGTPIVCTRMAVGRTAIPTVDVTINQDLKALVPNPGTDPKYLAHSLNYLQPDIEAIASGSTVRGISLNQLLKFNLYSPGLQEQRRIAEILDTLDDQISTTEQIITKLHQVKNGTLVTLLRHGIGDGTTSALGQFKDTAIGHFPTDWEVAPLSRLLGDDEPAMRSGPFGSALLKHELTPSGIPLLGIDNVHVDKFVANYTRFVSPKKARELSRYRVHPKDVMITIMGTVGRSCVVPDDVGKALSSKHVWTITINPNLYDSYLLSLQLNHAPWARARLRRDEQGGIMSAVRSETLKSILLPVPPIGEQRRIVEIMDQFDACIANESAKLKKLLPLKQGLMSDLLAGRVRVPAETV
ncbi:restriction endonuclease subunit S [Saccharomonospora piscinae]|uniref:restriction endonuclease subunit S n=1 Tax=Saccharomonospora piscinae TaxID=687388 RepID=UPI00110748F2|nr:restriction endonuclease subunit S [Saccharomonospora piscinae]TLW93556.1 restriction endonuclease subunit S [Saccharomonospora piscinae]